MGWVDEDTAAREAMGVKGAVGSPIEAVRISLSNGGAKVDTGKHPGEGKPSPE